MGLFSIFFKTEVNEYIASRSKARPDGFRKRKPSIRAITAFSAYSVNNISVWKCAGSGADGLSILSGERGQTGDVTLEESAENLKD